MKCARYWPDLNKAETYGNFHVHNVAEDVNKDYTLREFVVKHNSTDNWDSENGEIFCKEERKVYHYHFQVIYKQIFGHFLVWTNFKIYTKSLQNITK